MVVAVAESTRGAAARASRSLIASPRPVVRHRHHRDGRGAAASSARRCENRLAAASIRSPRARQVEHARCALGACDRHPGRRRAAPRPASTLARIEPQPRPRRIMRGELPGRERRLVVVRRWRRPAARIGEREHALDRRARQAARPQQHRLAEAGDDGRFEPDRRRPAVDDQVDAPAQIGEHMLRGGRRDVAGAVGRRRHHRPAEGCEDVARDRMAGHAHGDGVEPGGGELGHRAIRRPAAAPASAAPARTPPPAARRAASKRASAPRRGERRRTCAISGLNDGPALGVIEPRDRLAVGGVGAEPVDGLGREGDQPAGRQACARRARSPRRRRPVDHFASMPAAAVIAIPVPAGRACGAPRDAVIRPAFSRSVAQSGSAPRSGRGGRRFKSCHSDQLCTPAADFPQHLELLGFLKRPEYTRAYTDASCGWPRSAQDTRATTRRGSASPTTCARNTGGCMARVTKRSSTRPKTPRARSAQQYGEWLAEVEGRIAAIRAARDGTGLSLTPQSGAQARRRMVRLVSGSACRRYASSCRALVGCNRRRD